MLESLTSDMYYRNLVVRRYVGAIARKVLWHVHYQAI